MMQGVKLEEFAMKASTEYDFRRLPKTYLQLVAMLPPRPIHDDANLLNATEMIDRLAGFELNSDQEDYLEALSTFVEAYEAERYPIDDSRISPLDALKALVAEHQAIIAGIKSGNSQDSLSAFKAHISAVREQLRLSFGEPEY